jgi:hypothetical protein
VEVGVSEILWIGEGLEVFFYSREADISSTGSEAAWNVGRGIGIVIIGFFHDEHRGRGRDSGGCRSRRTD